jgi:hypothetical protein
VLTLGTNAGGIYLYTASIGAFSVQFSEIAVVGPPTQLIANGATTLSMTAGVAPTPTPNFRVADALGNSVPGVPLKATITLGTHTAVIGPFVADTIGLADVSKIAAQLDTAGTYTVTFASATTPATFAATLTYTITVNPAAAAKVVFVVGPSPVTANAVMSPAVTVAIQDSFGNLVTSSTASVTIGVDQATGAGVSATGSTLTVAAVNGIATFSNLKFSPIKTGVRLTATSGTLTSALSGTFNIQ